MRIVNKEKFIRSSLLLLLLIITICICLNNILTKSSKNVALKEDNYIVSKGDTLWSIAEKYKLEDEDPRQYIYDIKKINSNISTIYEGQTIKILMEDE